MPADGNHSGPLTAFVQSVEAVFSAPAGTPSPGPAEDLALWGGASSADYYSADAETTLVYEPSRVLYLCDYCKVTAIILYSLLSVVAFVGNSLILAAFLFIRRLRTPTNMLIANLAVADLMISVFCIPLSYWHVVIFEDQRWIFGAFLCKIFNYLQATAVFLSSWTLVAISFDRFMAIWFLMSPWLRINRRKALYVICATWAFSLTMALPLLIVNKVEVTAAGVDTCQERWELVRGFPLLGDDEAPIVHAYTLLVFALQYCLPLSVLLVTYTFIGLRMWNSKVPGEPTPHSSTVASCPAAYGSSATVTIASGASISQKSVHTQERRHESVKKLIPMVLLVSALYAGCWLPQNVLMNIWISYDPSITSHPYILYIWWGSHTLAMFHSIVNPFIYYCQNKRIHEALNYLLSMLPCSRESHSHTPLIPVHFTDDLNTTTTALGGANAVNNSGWLAPHKLSHNHKSGTDGIQIVNMVAYMPAVSGGKRIQPHSNEPANSALNGHEKKHSEASATVRFNGTDVKSSALGGRTTSIVSFSGNGNVSGGRGSHSGAITGSYAGGRHPTDQRYRDVW